MNSAIKKLFFDKSALKFMAVGCANVTVGASITFGLYNIFDCGYWFSSATSYIFASALSFFLNKRWTFQSAIPSRLAIAPFIINIALCYFAAFSIAKPIIYYMLENLGQTARDNIALLAGTCIFTALNYFGQRFFVFNTKERNAP
jgi:putative flippase GtrA